MKIVKQSYKLINPSTQEGFIEEAKRIELVARTCYKSEDKITNDSWRKMVKMLSDKNHGAMIEHSSMTVLFTTDRGVLAEITRHRLCSFAVESTRYCNYSKDKFDNEITVIEPFVEEGDDTVYRTWHDSMLQSEDAYFSMIKQGYSPQIARSVLPNSLKTEINITCNFREWQHIFRLRAISKAAHPMIRSLIKPLYLQCREWLPEIFDLGEIE
jgi:thymidylate synthase (FAD)